MTKTVNFFGTALAMFFILIGFLMSFGPAKAHAAAAPNASLGGGNALSRATSGESQGLTHANSSSNLLEHLTLASTRGGRSTETPPQEDGNGDVTESSLPNTANSNAADNANGGAQGGNGGSGGTSANGGLIRAGSVVSNSTAVNAINTNIIRISLR